MKKIVQTLPEKLQKVRRDGKWTYTIVSDRENPEVPLCDSLVEALAHLRKIKGYPPQTAFEVDGDDGTIVRYAFDELEVIVEGECTDYALVQADDYDPDDGRAMRFHLVSRADDAMVYPEIPSLDRGLEIFRDEVLGGAQNVGVFYDYDQCICTLRPKDFNPERFKKRIDEIMELDRTDPAFIRVMGEWGDGGDGESF